MKKDVEKETLKENKELDDLLKNIDLGKENKFEPKIPYVTPLCNDNNDNWLFGLLLLLMLDKDDFSPKQPSINIYIGGDK